LSFYVFIPARYGSSRFPGKPLIDLAGKTMIQRVYEQAACSNAKEVYVATDDERIADAVSGFSGQFIMTASDHATGTDRIHEAAVRAGLGADDTVVNVQGDEPLMPAAAINQVAAAISGDVVMSTLKEELTSRVDVFDPNVVKVVTDDNDTARYFSRAPVPWSRDGFPGDNERLPDGAGWFRHLGIYAYTMAMLQRYVSWPAHPLEQTEHLEQLRVLARGENIRVELSQVEIPPGIDVPEDVNRVLAALEAKPS